MKNKLFEFPKSPENFPKTLKEGLCTLLFHQISDGNEIVQNWVKGKFIIDTEMKFFILENSNLKEGIYSIKCILFYTNYNERYFYSLSNPYDFTVPEFKVASNMIFDAPRDEVSEQYKAWEKRVSIGEVSKMKNYKYSDIYIICSDALVTKSFRIGPAEIYPLQKSGIVDLSSSIKEALLISGERIIDLNEILNAIAFSDDKRSPMFLLRFPRVFIDADDLFRPVLPFIKKIFGILCLNRGAYSKIIGGVHIRQKDGKKDVYFMNLNSYYRGNLLGGYLAKENSILLNDQYMSLIKNSFITEIVYKLNSAYAETDLDLSYFRLWSILEYIANDIFNNKDKVYIKELIESAYGKDEAHKQVKLEIGEASFDLDQLLVMWLNWRDITAHNGGIHSYYEGKKKICADNKKMIVEMEKLALIMDYGEDRSNLLLKDVCSKVVEYYVNKAI